MNRRLFCFDALAFSMACGVIHAQTAVPLDDDQALWSLLVPQIEPRPGKGYLLARDSLKPDGLPYIQTDPPKTAIQKAIDASKQGPRRYETAVPEDMRQSFLEAVADASSRQNETVQITTLNLDKPYRLLTTAEVRSYIDLSPAVVSPDWKQDAKVAKYFKGWENLESISIPYFDKSKNLALICTTSHAGCYGSGWHFFARSGTSWTKLEWATESTCMVA